MKQNFPNHLWLEDHREFFVSFYTASYQTVVCFLAFWYTTQTFFEAFVWTVAVYAISVVNENNKKARMQWDMEQAKRLHHGQVGVHIENLSRPSGRITSNRSGSTMSCTDDGSSGPSQSNTKPNADFSLSTDLSYETEDGPDPLTVPSSPNGSPDSSETLCATNVAQRQFLEDPDSVNSVVLDANDVGLVCEVAANLDQVCDEFLGDDVVQDTVLNGAQRNHDEDVDVADLSNPEDSHTNQEPNNPTSEVVANVFDHTIEETSDNFDSDNPGPEDIIADDVVEDWENRSHDDFAPVENMVNQVEAEEVDLTVVVPRGPTTTGIFIGDRELSWADHRHLVNMERRRRANRGESTESIVIRTLDETQTRSIETRWANQMMNRTAETLLSYPSYVRELGFRSVDHFGAYIWSHRVPDSYKRSIPSYDSFRMANGGNWLMRNRHWNTRTLVPSRIRGVDFSQGPVTNGRQFLWEDIIGSYRTYHSLDDV